MFDASTFAQRRAALRALAGDAAFLFLGHPQTPRNYPANVYPFRQNSHVLYYANLNRPDVALVVTAEGDLLFGPEEHLDDVVWHGAHETLAEAAAKAGIDGAQVRNIDQLPNWLAERRAAGRPIAYLPPYQQEALIRLADMLTLTPAATRAGASTRLMEAVCAQRVRKTEAEIAEIESALTVTDLMHRAAFRMARAGVRECEVAAKIQEIASARGFGQSYNPIVTVHGEVLHNTSYANTLAPGMLLLNDSGAEAPSGYASDITRTVAVGGRFSMRQRDVYDVVLASQLAAIAAVRPGVRYRDVHLLACKVLTEGLARLGLMKGDPDRSVSAGAHALFFPHGLGHMLGLDVHDMEDLGDIVGYPGGEARSDQFGLNYLRMVRTLEPGHVVTIEPGIYFIPALIDRWRSEQRHREFLNYDLIDRYRDFGGIRIEDDVLCTATGSRVLGPGIPKTAPEVEAAAA